MPVPLPFSDNHCHLQDSAFSEDRDAVIARARAAGCQRFACAATHPGDWRVVLDLAAAHADILPTLGVHPWFVEDLPADWLDRLNVHLRHHPGCAIGEIGLDHLRRPAGDPLAEQVFRDQLALARALNRPAILHSVRCWGRMTELLKGDGTPAAGILLHAFSGPVELVPQLTDLGGWFSIAAPPLAVNRRKAHRAICAIPDHRLLIESDAPDMPPLTENVETIKGAKDIENIKDIDHNAAHPQHALIYRQNGKRRNEPVTLSWLLPKLAELRQTDTESLARTLQDNSDNFWESFEV